MEWIEIKSKRDVLPIIEEYKEYRQGIKEELEELKDDDSNHAMYRRIHLGTRNFERNKVSGFFNSKKIDALLSKGFDLKYNGIMLVIDTKNYNWGEFNYYPKSNKMYAKKWKKWYDYSWYWIEKKLINNDEL
jgi:hypothetical protein